MRKTTFHGPQYERGCGHESFLNPYQQRHAVTMVPGSRLPCRGHCSDQSIAAINAGSKTHPVGHKKSSAHALLHIVYVPIRSAVCQTCGERYYDRRTIRFLEEAQRQLQEETAPLQEVGKVLVYGGT
jgi:hypothetical protein